MELLPLVSGELWPVWFFFGSWCRELSQSILWPARFLLSAESACAEVGSCQVFVLPGCLQTSCSVSLGLVYLENNFGSNKNILWYMQEESSWRWWLDSCLGKEMYVGAAAGHQSQAILFCSFWDCHSALCSELVPNVFQGFPCMKWGLQHQWWTLCSSNFCVFHYPGSASASCFPWNV